MFGVFKKLNLKNETEILVVNAPGSFEPAWMSKPIPMKKGDVAMNYEQICTAVRKAGQATPTGAYQVDADALRKARQGTPAGEYHTST